MRHLVLVPVALSLLAGCASLPAPGRAGRLTREITVIQARVDSIESGISQSTGAIGAQSDAIVGRVRYRPIVEWADLFSSGPLEGRTVTFRQTSRSGDIQSSSRRCRVFPPFYRAGYYARIHESNSTHASLLIQRFAVTPTSAGLTLTSNLRFDAKTQVQGQWEPPCTGSSIGTNVGVTAEASPTAVFRLSLAGDTTGALRYALDLVSPDRIGLELAFHLGGFGRIRFTLPMEGLAARLTSGAVDLLFTREGQILLPDGQVVGYRLATDAPRFSSDTAGVTLATDVKLSIERPVVAGSARGPVVAGQDRR